MNGSIWPPIGQRERWQFRTINQDATIATYSRGCTINRGDFYLVRIPVTVDGDLDLETLSPDQRRFVTDNITPAEWEAAARRVRNVEANVSGPVDQEESAGRGEQSGSGSPRGDQVDGQVGDDPDAAGNSAAGEGPAGRGHIAEPQSATAGWTSGGSASVATGRIRTGGRRRPARPRD